MTTYEVLAWTPYYIAKMEGENLWVLRNKHTHNTYKHWLKPFTCNPEYTLGLGRNVLAVSSPFGTPFPVNQKLLNFSASTKIIS